jgi:hypothetical protein
MHVVENPNFPSLRFDPLADLFFAISDLLLKSLLLKSCTLEEVPLKIALLRLPPDFADRRYSPPSKMFFDM